MKNILITTIITLLLSCNVFSNRESEAIEICQKAKVQFQTDNELANLFLSSFSLGSNATWLDFANMIAKKNPNTKYDWHAQKTEDNKYYIVTFADPEGWGQRWEVDVDQKIVKSINQNEYLSRKYGLSRFDDNKEFVLTQVQKSEIKLEKRYNYFENTYNSEIIYIIKASVLNNTTNTNTSARIEGKLKLIFKDKTVSGASNFESGFQSRISKNKPWEPNTKREFYIKTRGIEKIYLNYIPEYVVLDISLEAEDPTGYSFNKDIADMDLKTNWIAFKKNPQTIEPPKYKQNQTPVLEDTVASELPTIED